jgi:hypothetical protein
VEIHIFNCLSKRVIVKKKDKKATRVMKTIKVILHGLYIAYSAITPQYSSIILAIIEIN